VFQMDADK